MTLTVVAAVVAGVASGLVAFRWLAQRPASRRDGVAEFQRHLDALSPDARRGVLERGRGAERAVRGD